MVRLPLWRDYGRHLWGKQGEDRAGEAGGDGRGRERTDNSGRRGERWHALAHREWCDSGCSLPVLSPHGSTFGWATTDPPLWVAFWTGMGVEFVDGCREARRGRGRVRRPRQGLSTAATLWGRERRVGGGLPVLAAQRGGGEVDSSSWRRSHLPQRRRRARVRLPAGAQRGVDPGEGGQCLNSDPARPSGSATRGSPRTRRRSTKSRVGRMSIADQACSVGGVRRAICEQLDTHSSPREVVGKGRTCPGRRRETGRATSCRGRSHSEPAGRTPGNL